MNHHTANYLFGTFHDIAPIISNNIIILTLLLSKLSSVWQNSNVERQNRSGNALVFYLMEQLYDMKPKIETLKTKIKDMEIYIAAQKKQIETLQNRKSTS